MARRSARRRNDATRRTRHVLLTIGAIVVVAAAIAAGVSIEAPRSTAPPGQIDDTGGPAPSVSRMRVTAGDLNLRAEPSLDADVIGSGAEGDLVEVTGEPVDGFVPVRVGIGSGWMSAQYLAADSGESSLPRVVTGVEPAAAADIHPETSIPDEPDDPAVEPAPRVPQETPDSDEYAPGDVAGEPPVEVVTAPTGERWIEVDRSSATITLHHGDTIVAIFTGKLGRDPSTDGFYATAIGTFHVYSMSDGPTETPFADGVYLTNWVGFDPDRHNGFHSPVLDAQGNEAPSQSQTTLGCVRLDAAAARTVFDFAHVGMRVEVHD